MAVLGARNEIDAFAMETIRAFNLLVGEDLNEQALVLLYSAIDRLAWVALESGDVTKSTFCAWVDKYIDPEESIGCTSTELYAARCGILHAGTAESSLSRKEDAREIWYERKETLANAMEIYGKLLGKNIIVINPTVLFGWFCLGADKFNDEIEANPQKKLVYQERVKNWIRFRPSSQVIDEIESLAKTLNI